MPRQRPIDRHHFGVVSAHGTRVAPPQHAISPVDHGPHGRIRCGATARTTRLGERQPHRGLGVHGASVRPSMEAKYFA